ncbi:cupin domain-containing protein [Streptomyces sp. NPDC058086]|uniref:cupin domain-containing protein n=1 Tax=Streptomyces sp. NPDC058086 TaxID=3346334 RepID=UPI0036F01AED
MSYPEPRYFGERGRVSALFRPTSSQPDTGFSGGDTDISYVAQQEHTDGEFGLYKIDMRPKAMGATEHFHRTISESFYVLSGEVRLYNGERWVTGREGDFLYVPAGGLHAFQNDSDDPVSLLLLFTPGAPREEYFEMVAEYSQRSREELKAFRVRHDQYNTDMLDD